MIPSPPPRPSPLCELQGGDTSPSSIEGRRKDDPKRSTVIPTPLNPLRGRGEGEGRLESPDEVALPQLADGGGAAPALLRAVG